MATAGGRTDPDLSDSVLAEKLTREPQRFNFFQAVRLLERVGKLFRSQKRDPGLVGEDESPRDEVVRFYVPPSLSFPSSEIGAFQEPTEDQPPKMAVSFLGLTGPAGVLPRHYTQMVIERGRQKDFTFRDFLDVFHHRLIALFYRAWRKYRFFVGYERAAETGKVGEDDFTQSLYALVGFGTRGLRSRQDVHDETWLYYAGQFSHRPRNAISLAAMAADYLALPTRVEQFVGQWLYLERSDQSSLSDPHGRQSPNNCLGSNVVVGDRVWGIEQRIRLRLGPLSYSEFLKFVPCGDRLRRIAQFTRTYVGAEFDLDFQPILRKDEVPMCRLGGPTEPSRLGWNTWLISEQPTDDASEPIFTHDGWASN